MHIIIANDYANVRGGADEVAITSARILADAGERITFFCGVGPVDPKLVHPGIRVVCLGQEDILQDPNRLRGMLRGMANPAAAAALASILNECHPSETLLHLHGWTKCLTATVVRAATRRGFSSLLTLHDYFAVCPNGAFFEFQKKKICRRKPLAVSCLACQCDRRSRGHKLWRVARQYAQRALGLPGDIRHAIAVSELNREISARDLPVTTKLHVVYSPVPVARAACIHAGDNSDITYLGRLAYEKGAQLLAQAAAETGAPVRFVGEGEMRAEILRLNPAAEITGWVSPAEAMGWIERSRAVVLPSLWMETFGLTVAQALSCGIPVIVSDHCGARDLVRDGVNGFIIPAGDVAALRDKVLALQDSGLASALGAAAYERFWSDPLDAARHVRDLRQIYEEVLSEQRPSGRVGLVSAGAQSQAMRAA